MRVHPSKSILWCVLALPALFILAHYWTDPAGLAGAPLEATGEWSARLTILALMLTPLLQVLPSSPVRWLVRHRRAFGVAAFAYAFLHLLFYGLDVEGLVNMIAELSAPGIWTAWLALLCLLPPALASSDPAMRALGRLWKTVQRLAYPAAILTLVHWMLVHDGLVEALLHFTPLAALQLLRITRTFTPRPLERNIA